MRPNFTAITCSLLVTLLWYPAGYEAADPVYTPQNLSDTSGNFAFSNATVIWADLPAGEAYAGTSVRRVSEGLESYYNMVHGFIATVLPKPIPDDLVNKLLGGKTGEIVSNYSNYTSFFIGYAICVVFGILFMLIVPIICCCFCCCRRCCKKCGGKMVQSDEDSKSFYKKWTYSVILLIIIIFMISGAVCIFLNNNATSTAINDIPKNTVSNLKDLKVYVNNTVLEATHLIQNNYNFLNASLNRELDNIGFLVGLPLRVDIETNTGIRTTLTNAYSLVASLDNADTALSDIESNETALRTSVSTMEARLNNVKTELNDIFSSCGSCPTTGRPDYATALSTGFDSNNFPDLSGPRSSMDTAKSTNMTAQLVDAESEVDGIPDTVVNDSKPTVDDMQQKISNLSDNIDPIMNQIKDINKMFIGSNASIDLDKLSDDVTNFGETLEQYDKYRWYGGLSLACMVLLFVTLLAAGLLLGIFGTNTDTHPANRGCLANCGGILLMSCVYLIFFFSVLLMLLTTFPFLIGAPVHKLACVPITDLSEMDKLTQIYSDHDVGAGKYFLGKMLLDNDTIPLTLGGMLRDCRDGKSAYSSFKMTSKFDLNDLLNYSKTLDVQAEIDSMNVDLSSVNVYPSDLQTQLSDLRTAININFTSFYTELSSTPTGGDLGDLAGAIETYANSVGVPTATKTALDNEAADIRSIKANEYADVNSTISALNTSVGNMESAVSGIPSQVDSLDTGLNTTNTYIQTTTATVVRNLLNTYANRLLGIADSFTAHIEDGMTNKVGKCEPVWNLYNSLMVYTFCYNLMDTFNGFWFSLGWCVFFSMLGLIFSVKLAKYFRRMRDMEYTRENSATPSKMFDNKVYPDETPTGTKADLVRQRSNQSQVYNSECIQEHVCDLSERKIIDNSGKTCNSSHEPTGSSHPANVDIKPPYEVSLEIGGTNKMDNHEVDIINSNHSIAIRNDDKDWNTTVDGQKMGIIAGYDLSRNAETTNAINVAENNKPETIAENNNSENIAENNNAENIAETSNKGTIAETNNAENVAETINARNIAETNNAENIAETNNAENIAETNNAENNNTENISKAHTIENIENKDIPHIIYVTPIETEEMYNTECGGTAINAKLELNMKCNRGETQTNGVDEDGLLSVPVEDKEGGIHRNVTIDDVSDIESKNIDDFVSGILHNIIDNDKIHNSDTI